MAKGEPNKNLKGLFPDAVEAGFDVGLIGCERDGKRITGFEVNIARYSSNTPVVFFMLSQVYPNQYIPSNPRNVMKRIFKEEIESMTKCWNGIPFLVDNGFIDSRFPGAVPVLLQQSQSIYKSYDWRGYMGFEGLTISIQKSNIPFSELVARIRAGIINRLNELDTLQFEEATWQVSDQSYTRYSAATGSFINSLSLRHRK